MSGEARRDVSFDDSLVLGVAPQSTPTPVATVAAATTVTASAASQSRLRFIVCPLLC
jgi:hypothetical protein